MSEARCYLCGHDNALPASAIWTRCTGCGRPLHVGSARQLAAIERLARSARGEPDLDAQCRTDLLTLLQRHQLEVSATAARLAPPTPQPPPLPAELPAKLPAELPAELPPESSSAPWPEPASTTPAPADPARASAATSRATGPQPTSRGPSLWSRLGPLFAENLLFALAGFLLVAGAVYFTTTAWTTMSGSTQKLVVAGGLLLFAALTHGAGTVLGRHEGLRAAARVLSLVAMALSPAASAVAGLLHAANPALALLVAAAAATCGHLFLVALARREGHAVPRVVPWLTDALVFSGAFAGALQDMRLFASCVAAAVPLAAAWLLRREHRASATVPATAICALLATVIAAMALAIGMAIAHGPMFAAAVAPLGFVTAAAALAAVVLESARSQRAPAALTAALAVAVSAVLVATGDLRCLMVAAWCAAATCAQVSLRLDRARLLMPALVLSAVGYLFLPAPVRELAMRLRAEAASQLGYEPQRLPLSFYGITFLPYLIGLALLGMWFRRSERGRHRRVCSGWAVSVAAGLAAMSLLSGRDLRAPMAVLPADGLLLVLLGYLSCSVGAVLAGCLGVLGGLACALIWLEVPAGVGVAAGAAGAMVLLRLARGPDAADSFAARARRSYLRAAVIAVGAGVVCSMLSAWPPEQFRVWSLLHATVLVPAFGLLRWPDSPLQNVVRRAAVAPALLALPVLWATATGVAAGLEALGAGTARAAMPAALAIVTFAANELLRQLRPLDPQREQANAIVRGLFALHVFVLPDLIAAYDPHTFRWITLLGTAALAMAARSLAGRQRLDALLATALVEATFPAHLLAAAWLGSASGTPGLVGPTALMLAAALLGARRPAIAVTARGMALVAGVLTFGLRLGALPVPGTRDAMASLAIAGMLAVVPLLRARRSSRSIEPVDSTWVAVGALVALTGPIALLDLLVHGLPQYAAGMLGIAALAFGAAARWRSLALWLSTYGLLQVAIAIVLLFCWQPFDERAQLWRMGQFAAAALMTCACRPRALRTVATLLMAAAAFGLLVLEPIALHWCEPRQASVLVLGWCALALGLAALPRWHARARGVLIFSVPIVVAAAVALALSAAIAAGGHLARSTADLELLDANTIAFLVAAFALAMHVPSRFRAMVAWVAVGIAASATTPIHGMLSGDRRLGQRPDAEAATLALAIAILGRRHAHVSWSLALAAVLLTTFRLQDLSTPVTMTLLAGVPLALMLRRLPGTHAALHGALLVLATWSWIAFALTGRNAAQIGPWLALSSAALGMLCGPWLRFVATDAQVQGQILALRAVVWIAALGALLAVCVAPSNGMPVLELSAALAASTIVAISSMRAARAPEQAPLLQLGLAAVVTAYLILVAGTDLLAVMNGRHHHALTVLGATLFLIAGHGATPVRQQLRATAVLAPLLAVLLALGLGGLTFALLSGALVMGLGAALARARWLAALALMLANSGLFHLWLRQGVFDPSFYGVPAGLSLVFGAELARRPLGDARVIALRVTGLAVLYGSVLVQVARVSVPLHALALFALAMAAVAYGAMRRQAAIMVTGVAAVVLDVVAYLAQRGFEQDFLGSVLLVGAGSALFVVAVMAARRRTKTVPPLA